MNTEHLIFVGFELTETVKSLLDACSERDAIYLEDSTFLETVEIEDKSFVGKRIKDGAAIDRIEDTARSVVSLLTRVNADWDLKPHHARVMAVEPSDDSAGTSPDGDDAANRFDYLGLVD